MTNVSRFAERKGDDGHEVLSAPTYTYCHLKNTVLTMSAANAWPKIIQYKNGSNLLIIRSAVLYTMSQWTQRERLIYKIYIQF